MITQLKFENGLVRTCIRDLTNIFHITYLRFDKYLSQITQLKIDNNPFAKGFREAGAGKSAKK